MAEPEIINLKPRVADTQTQLYYKDGSPIAPEDTAGAVARGEAFSTGDTVRVNVDNTPGAVVPTSGLANFLAQRGASVETTKQAKRRELRADAAGIGGAAKLVPEALIRGASAGFVEPALMYGDDGRQAALLRKEEHPWLAGGVELAGAVGAAVAASALTGGAAAPEAGAGVLARLASITGRGLAEGAVFGAGHEFSEAALQNVPLTAERLLAGAWDGAKVGGAFGLGLGVLSSGVGKAGRAIVGRMSESGDDLERAAGTWAERAAFKQQIGNQGKFFDQATKFGRDQAGPARIGRKLLDADMPTSAPAALKRAEELRAGALERMNAVVKSVDDAGVVTNPGNILSQVDDQIAKIRDVPFGDAQAVADRIEKNIKPFRERFASKAPEAPPAPEVAAAPKPYNYNEAARPFDDVMDDVERSLSKAERDEVWDYTTTSYKHMNEAARDPSAYMKQWGSPTMLAEKQVKNARLQAILEKQVADGRAYRGEVERIMEVPEDTIRKWLDDGAVTNGSFWSTTADPAEFAKTLLGEHQKANVRLYISHADAVPVANFSKVAAEKEALIPPGRTFFINNSETRDGVHHIWLEQVHSSDNAFASRLLSPTAPAAPNLAATAIGEAQPVKLSDLWKFRQELDKSINFEAAQRGPAKEALMDMRKAFVAEIDDTISRAAETSGMDPKLLAAWKQATEDYGDFALIKDGLKGLIKQRGKNRAISPSDYATGAMMSILTGDPLTGMATGALTSGVHKLIRERGLGVMAKIADRVGNVSSRVETAAKVAAMVESPKRIATPAAINVGQVFQRYSTALTEAKADPAKFSERMADATADLAIRTPELASQVQQTMLADLAYLDRLHPRPTSSKVATLTPLAVTTEFYSYDQRKAFVDAAVALDNPVGVFDDLARGELPLTKLNALKERRPLLFSEMQQTVIKYTAQRKEELPYNRRMLLGVAFGFPADWSMANIGKIQESLVAAANGGPPMQSMNDPRAAPSKVNADPGKDMSPGVF